jgi:hypothetical protein
MERLLIQLTIIRFQSRNPPIIALFIRYPFHILAAIFKSFDFLG